MFEILEQNLSSEIKARSFRLTSSGVTTEESIVKRGIALGLNYYGSPTLSDQAFLHFPSIKIGPGDSFSTIESISVNNHQITETKKNYTIKLI